MARGKASPSSVDDEGTRQSSLLFSLEEEEEEGKALSPSLEKDGNVLSCSLLKKKERRAWRSPLSLEQDGKALHSSL